MAERMWKGKEVYYPKQVIEQWEVEGEFGDFTYKVMDKTNNQTEILAERDGREVRDHMRYFIARRPTLNPPEHKIHALCRYLGYMCHIGLLDKEDVLEHYCEARDFELFAQGKGKIAALLRQTKSPHLEEQESKQEIFSTGGERRLPGNAYDLLVGYFRGEISEDQLEARLADISKSPFELEWLGQRVFYIKQAIKEWHTNMGYDYFLYEVTEAEEAPHHRDTKVAARRIHERGTAKDSQRFFTTTDNENVQKGFVRLCRYLGFLCSREVFRLYEISEIADDIALSMFPKGKGKLAAKLSEAGFHQEALDYALGKVELDPTEQRALLSGGRAGGAAVSVSKKPRKRASIGKRQNGDEKKVALELPKLENPEQISEYVGRVYDGVKEKVIGQDGALRKLILRLVKYIKDGEKNKPSLITGPTGCGKTYSMRLVTEAMGLPFVRVVLPDVVPHGIVGPSLQDLMLNEINAVRELHGGHPERLVLQVDEFDKIVHKELYSNELQNEFLKLLEPDAVLTVGRRHGPEVESVRLDSLILLSGAFSFVDYDPDKDVSPEMLREAGFIEEIIGRIDSTVMLRKLGVDDYLFMLRKPVPLLGEYLEESRGMGIEAELSDGAMERLAEIAAESGLGARSLESAVGAAFGRVHEKVFFDEPGGKVDGLELSRAKDSKLWKVKIGKEFVVGPEGGKKRLPIGFGGR